MYVYAMTTLIRKVLAVEGSNFKIMMFATLNAISVLDKLRNIQSFTHMVIICNSAMFVATAVVLIYNKLYSDGVI